MASNKKILIVSHERSGTHFLINSIAANFGFQERQIDLDLVQGFSCFHPAQATAWLERYRGLIVPQVFKSHHARALLMPVLRPMLDEFHVIYVCRDGRDVMTSFWRYLNNLQPGWGPQTLTPGEFMRARPLGGILQYQAGPGETMLSRWIDHVAGWHEAGNAVHLIAYEHLHRNFEATIRRLGEFLNVKSPDRLLRPGLDAYSSIPWRGVVGSWQEYFSPDDDEYFNSRAGALMERLGIPLGRNHSPGNQNS